MKYTLIIIGALIITSCMVGEKKQKSAVEMEANESVELKSSVGKVFGFYNVENLFDTIDDKYTIDEQFLPSAEKQWTSDRYNTKLTQLATVISSFDKKLPVFLGMAEIENKAVIEDLIKTEKLSKGNYGIVHEQSPDKRGIDVGFIYRKDYFKVIEHKNMEVVIADEPDFYTRDILYVKGELKGNDVVHVFLNHWPSRSSGQEKSEYKRLRAATVLRAKVDEVLKDNKDAKIIIMGDFNDYPNNKSITQVLRAKDERKFKNGDLYNMAAGLEKDDKGTYNYKGDWGMLDQLIISEAVFKSKEGVTVGYKDCKVLQLDFMLYTDPKYGDKKPSKTYGGPNYYGGYSDHLPILTRFK
jgi:predicted extracellular nuclease